MSEAEATQAEPKTGPKADVKRCVELLEHIVSFMDARQRAVKSGLAPVPFLEGVGLNVIDAAGQFTVMVERLGDEWLEARMRPNPGLVRASEILDEILGRDALPSHGGLTATDAEMRRLRSALERARGELTGSTADSRRDVESKPRVPRRASTPDAGGPSFGEVVDKLRRIGKLTPAALVEYMENRQSEGFDEIKDRVHGDSEIEDSAVRKNASETSKLIQRLGARFRFATRGGRVYREAVTPK